MINRKIVIGARLSFLTIRACVLGSLADSLDREPAFIRTRARLRWRAHESITPGLNRAFDTTPPAIQSAAIRCPTSQGSVIATGTSLLWRNWGRTVERTSNPALRFGPLLQQGTCWILNFCRRLAGSSFNPRVKHLQEPTRGLFHRLVVSKVLLLPAAVHAQNKAWSKQHGAPKISVPGA